MRRLLPLIAFAALFLAALPVAHTQDAAEIEFWQSVKDSRSASELEAYLSAYPNGKFAALARIRLKGLTGGDPPDAVSPVSGGDSKDGAKAEPRAGSNPREKVVSMTLMANPGIPEVKNKAFMGAGVIPLNEGLAVLFGLKPNDGVLVNRVVEETPAEAAGLGPGIVILELDGVAIGDAQDLVNEVGRHAPGDAVSLKILLATKTEAEFEQLLREGAAKGNGDAMMELGYGYDAGTFVDQDDKAATRWYWEAAKTGKVRAMSELGLRYIHGTGVTQDDAKALRWVRQAAEKDETSAMHNYGWMLEKGRGTKKDPEAAIGWYRKAAEKGYANSMWGLGVAYENGNGVAKDPVQAVRWYQRAAALGHKQAIEHLETLGVSTAKPAADGDAPDLDDVAEDIGELD